MTSLRESPQFVVGVGASAGGLEALEQLFGAMPEDTGMAFVVVQHLSPDFKSVMDELLARRTRIPVLLVEDGVAVEPNRIYLIPPKKDMIISGGHLLLSDKGGSAELALPIDIFFRSLAQDAGERAIGVVLSGAGSDGARGIRDIHDAGGLVLCQDERSADFNGMPRSALETGVVDHVATPAELPAVLIAHARRETVADKPEPVSATPYGITAALRALQDAYGIDFAHYKQSTVVRRIERRLQLTQASSLQEYVERLSADRDELDALFHDLLIGVTRFFRDDGAFRLLEQSVIPQLLDRRPAAEEVRVWIAGCATGEEAYSVAILFQEELRRRGDPRRVKILATDVHRRSLEFASRGLYGEDRLSELRGDWLERYFSRQGPCYQVSPELRQLLVFAPHNVVKDAPFTRIDFISCRNMLIYLQPLAQKKVLSLLHFALKRQGILILGPSENVGGLVDDFEAVDTHWRIYRKQRDMRLPTDTRIAVPRQRALPGGGHEGSSGLAGYSLSQVVGVYDALLDEHMPPSLLVNERRELVHAFGGASRYLSIKDGRPSADLLDMLGHDLRMIVTGAMQRALKERAAVTYNGLVLRVDRDERSHRVTVKPIAAPGSLEHVLITLTVLDSPAPEPAAGSEMDLGDLSRHQLGSLEAELRRTKESLQATIEELETSNEELQATNEELLASNEELQSTNEELQSVNEELYTVNAEYQKKISELTLLTNDMDNLLASIEVGTIFLDADLCIRKFTPRSAEVFSLLPQDIGRPISGFRNTLRHAQLDEDLEGVLRSGRAVEREICDRAGKWFFLRVLPYRARGEVSGVVLTLIDIDGLKSAEDAVFRERYLLNSLMDSVPDLIWFKDASGRFVRVNRAMADWLALPDSQAAVGKTVVDLVPEPARQALEQPDERALAGHALPYCEESLPGADGEPGWYMTTRQPLRDPDGRLVGMLGVGRDISEQKRSQDEIRLAVRRRDEFLAMLSHELRNPLAAIVNAIALLQRTGAVTDAQEESIDVIGRQSRQMTRLLDDLLEVARITQNKIELRKQALDARSVVEEAVTAVRDKLSARGVRLHVDLPTTPVPVLADPARLQQILVNLLDNASKYNRAGGAVWLQLRSEGKRACLRVADDGAGLPPALLGDIFEPFVQGTATLDRTEGGMGVGLSVVRSLIEMHGGQIEARSEGPGRGSEFIAWLPGARNPVQPAPRVRIRWPGGKRVVVVEDNADGCEMLRLLLENAGYQVFTAGDGVSGCDVIERVEPDIAIIDIGLPRMNGLDLCRQLRARQQFQGLYMVALTGYGQESDIAATLEAGFDEHLVKPLDLEELTRLMESREG